MKKNKKVKAPTIIKYVVLCFWALIDIYPLFGDYSGAAVLGVAETVENSSQHIFGNAQFEAPSEESCL